MTSGCRFDASSKIGAKLRHGPHQAAQESRKTRPVSTVDLKLASVRCTVGIVFAPAHIIIPRRYDSLHAPTIGARGGFAVADAASVSRCLCPADHAAPGGEGHHYGRRGETWR